MGGGEKWNNDMIQRVFAYDIYVYNYKEIDGEEKKRLSGHLFSHITAGRSRRSLDVFRGQFFLGLHVIGVTNITKQSINFFETSALGLHKEEVD